MIPPFRPAVNIVDRVAERSDVDLVRRIYVSQDLEALARFLVRWLTPAPAIAAVRAWSMETRAGLLERVLQVLAHRDASFGRSIDILTRHAGESVRARRGVAFHEAGHAFVAALRQVPFTYVTIKASAAGAGHLDLGTSAAPSEAIERIDVLLAGELAECIGCGARDARSSADDRVQAVGLATLVVGAGGDRATALLNERQCSVRQLLEGNRAALIALADALLARETLTAADVLHLVAQ